MIYPNGRESETTFWNDFSIADAFGVSAIKDTYKRAFAEWKDDVKYMAEFVTVLNLKCWDWYDRGNDKLSGLYSDLYYKANDYCYDHFKGADADYYFEFTD